MFFPKDQNDYALNKADPDAIVYRDRKDKLHRLTAPEFESPEEFEKWKRISDESYHGIFKGDHRYYKHKVSLGKQDLECTSTAELERAISHRQSVLRRYRLVEKKLQRVLTRTQLRRFKMHHEYQMSQEEIAAVEGVSQCMVSKSIASAEKRIQEKIVNNL